MGGGGVVAFFFSSRRRHTRLRRDWSSDVCSSDLIVITLIALAGSLVLIQALLPLFNTLAFKSLSFNYLERWPVLLIMVAGAVGVGFITGLYPAFALSAFKPVDVLKGQLSTGKGSSWMRQSLVVFQFGISVVLIIAAVIAQRQLSYMRSEERRVGKECRSRWSPDP